MIRKNIKYIKKQKNLKKIVCLTAYTASIAKIIDKYVDIILIGDSLGTVIYGMKNTQKVTMEMMIEHGKAVCKSSKKAFTIIDMPYNTFNKKRQALINAKKLIKNTKCKSVKIEADHETVDIIKHLVKNKIEVVSHIGILPQKFKNFNKIRAIGKKLIDEKKIIDLALKLEKAGSSIIVLECVKESVAKKISLKLKIPTIGIGASVCCDGQILVTNDILQTTNNKNRPKFVKPYANLYLTIDKAIKKFSLDVINKKFPTIKNTY